jgi:16S rRNA (guanine527-N7)-methyltransferase
LDEVLEESADAGFLGPGPVAAHAAQAGSFLAALRPADRVLDLGAGGGVPGLILALALPAASFVLLDASQRRTDFLRRAVRRLGLADRVGVVTARAEAAGHDAVWRGTFDAVVARSFAEPAVTAECAAPFLRVGGQLVVSEPPDPRPGRWPPDGLGVLGLEPDPADEAATSSFTQVRPCPARYARRRLQPPLFHVEPP